MASLQYFFGGKYDLIQLHRQIIHQNARIFKRNSLIPSPPAIYIYLKKTMKMTWYFVISAVWAGAVFGPRLWQLSARRRSLAGPWHDINYFDKFWIVNCELRIVKFEFVLCLNNLWTNKMKKRRTIILLKTSLIIPAVPLFRRFIVIFKP